MMPIPEGPGDEPRVEETAQSTILFFGVEDELVEYSERAKWRAKSSESMTIVPGKRAKGNLMDF
jgi:hypothetical protein